MKKLLIFALIAGLCLLGCEGPTGPNGPNGDDGKNGTNSTEQGDKGEQGQQGEKGEPGEKGDDYDGDATALNGHDGPKGFNGASVVIMGVIATEDDLPYPGGVTQDDVTEAYIVGGILYVWDRTNEVWINTGQEIQGVPGEQGDKGPTGKAGAVGGDPVTVYEVAFDSANGSGAEPNIVTVFEGGKIRQVNPPAAKTLAHELPVAGGLYRDDYTFTGWYEVTEPEEEGGDPIVADTTFDFDQPITKSTTLVAGWLPINLAPIGETITVQTAAAATTDYAITDANFIEAAFAYVNGYGAQYAGSYILCLDKNYTTGPNKNVTQANRNLKIIALQDDPETPVNRTITLNTNGTLMSVSATNSSVTLGKSVHLVGRAGNTTYLVVVGGNNTCKLIMEDGSVIRGNACTAGTGTAGVYVSGGTLVMKPGSQIYNMTMSTISSGNAGIAVYVSNNVNSALVMEGGQIRSNTGAGLADVYIGENNNATSVPLMLSGGANPGSVMLNKAASIANRAITLAEDWEGTVTLDLRGATDALLDVFGMWYDKATPANSPTLFIGLTDENIDQITLRNFVDNLVTEGNVDSISQAVAIGALFRDEYVLDADTGKLKLKD